MRRRSPSSSSRDRRSRRSRSEDRRSDRRVDEEKDKRREAWLIQQEREREHEIRKQKMIFDYELKRAALLNKANNSSPHNQSTSRNKDGSTNITKPPVMSEKHETPGGSEPLFRGPSTSTKPTEAELRQIKVDIHRNIPGPVNPNIELHREIVNPEDVIVARREDEGKRPIFDDLSINESKPLTSTSGETRIIRNEKLGNTQNCSTAERGHRSQSIHSLSRIPVMI